MAHFNTPDGQRAGVTDYAESAYYGGFHFRHIAAWLDSKREARLAGERRAAGERRERERRATARLGIAGRRASDQPATLATVRPRPVLRSVA